MQFSLILGHYVNSSAVQALKLHSRSGEKRWSGRPDTW
jgi:hypothetical protein